MSTTEFQGVVALFDVKPSTGLINLTFKNIPLPQLMEFVEWQGSEDGLKAIQDSLISALIANGIFTPEQIATMREEA